MGSSFSATSITYRGWCFIAAPLLIMLVGFLAYSNSFQGCFLLDDEPMIVDNPTIRQLTPMSKFVFEGGLRKLPTISFAVNYAIGGLDPVGYHYFNVAIHLLAAVFLYGLMYVTLTCSVWPSAIRSQAALLAFFVSLLWVVHPLNTQAVNYVVQRIEAMMGLSFFLFMWLYASSHYAKQRRMLLGVAWIVFCLGLGCKEVMVMSLPVAMLYDRAFLFPTWREAAQARGVFWLACALPLAVAAVFIVPIILGSEGAVGLSLKSVTPLQYLSTQPEVIFHYLRLVVVPWPQVFDYGWEPETNLRTVLMTIVPLLGMLAGLCWLYIHKPHFAFWGLAAALVLFPTSSFIPLQDLAVEHRMYVPLAFLLVPVVMGLFSVGSRYFGDHPALISSVLCFGLCGMLAMLTLSRNQDYRTAVGMWEDVISKTVDSGSTNMLAGRAYSNLGNAYADKAEWDKSIDNLEKAQRCRQFAPSVYGNLARAYVATGKAELARQYSAKALELEPTSARLRQQAGLIETMSGNLAEAEKHFREAHELAPADTVIMVNLAECNLQLKNISEAEALLRKAILADGKAAEALKRLVDLLLSKGEIDSALDAANDYAKTLPKDPRANLQLGMIWAAKGENTKAIEQLEIASKFDPPPAEANYLLGNARRSTNDLVAARHCYEKELKHFPKNADALSKLAELVARENPQLAVAYFQRVIDLAPRAWQARYNVAAVHVMLGKKDLAREQLAVVLKMNPEFEPAKQLLKSLD